MKQLIYFVLLSILFGACSSGQKALEQGDYIQAIDKAVNRLANDPNNKKAKKVLTEGYPMAMDYYQEEIDETLGGNDPFKWGKTLDIMYRVNQLGDLIRRVPAARKLVPSPKSYTSELQNVTERAAEERYLAGMASLERPAREDAKNAYFHFRQADQLVPSYKDALSKMAVAKERATIKVILETIPLPSKRYELSADFFYRQVIDRMNQKFPRNTFVNFYTPEEAEKSKIKYPDMVVRFEFYDFFVGNQSHYEKEENLSRIVEKEVEVKVGRDSVRIEKRQEKLQGRIKVITDEVASGGLLNVKIEEFQSQKKILDEAIPGEFVWRNQYGIFVGDNGVLTENQVRILNNQAVPPPAPQDMFIEFTRPIYVRLTDRLTAYFNKYN
jgi:hypothetical protein